MATIRLGDRLVLATLAAGKEREEERPEERQEGDDAEQLHGLEASHAEHVEEDDRCGHRHQCRVPLDVAGLHAPHDAADRAAMPLHSIKIY